MDRLLIVNADDYGLTEATSKAVLRAHRDGIVTSTSVLAVGRAFKRAAPWLLDQPELGVGGHLAAVGEDPPLLTRREIPSLVDRHGRFPLSWRAFLGRAGTGRIDPADLEREFGVQIERLTRDAGLRLTHLDTHQHLHLWPPVARVVTELARRHGIAAVRLPRSHASGPKGYGIRWLGDRLARMIAEAGLTFPADYAGLDEAGGLALPRFVAALEMLAAPRRTGAGTLPGSVEINCHPGSPEDPDRARYAWGYRWGEELAALVDPALRDTVRRLGFRLGDHTELSRSVHPVGE